MQMQCMTKFRAFNTEERGSDSHLRDTNGYGSVTALVFRDWENIQNNSRIHVSLWYSITAREIRNKLEYWLTNNFDVQLLKPNWMQSNLSS